MQFEESSPIYLQIVRHVKRMILSGRLKRGERLISVREMAVEMGVNPNTIQRALALLEEEGLLRTERTSGRYVTDDPVLIERRRRWFLEEETRRFLSGMMDIGLRPADIASYLTEHEEALL